MEYLRIAEDENEQAIELPLEKDDTMLLTTVTAVFPGACGIKFRNPETNAFRAVRLSEGALHPPAGGWDAGAAYLCVFPLKRKLDESEVGERGEAKTKRLEKKLVCTDLICLGLPWKCTEESARKYFEQFGDVVMMQMKKDAFGKFKGFGFIRFGTYEAQMRALGQRHNIDGRWVDVCIPNSKGGVLPQVSSKVFVGRCTVDITAEDLRAYFSEFGEVIDVFVPRPFRAFAFVTFLDPEVAQSLCGEDHVIKSASVSVSSAEPVNRKPRYGGGGGGGGGPRGGDGPQGNWNNNYNFDSLSMQSLGIGGDTSVSVPVQFVAAALNAGLMGSAHNGGGPGDGGRYRSNQGFGRFGQGGGGGGRNWPQKNGTKWNNGSNRT